MHGVECTSCTLLSSSSLRIVAASHCNMLQHILTHLNNHHLNTLQHTATHCNTLQHAATHCTTGARGLIHIRHSPFALTIVAGQTSPAHSNTNGTCSQHAHAHQICSFSLWLRDAYSNTRDSGGDDVRAHLMGPFAVQDHAGHTASHCNSLQHLYSSSYAAFCCP